MSFSETSPSEVSRSEHQLTKTPKYRYYNIYSERNVWLISNIVCFLKFRFFRMLCLFVSHCLLSWFRYSLLGAVRAFSSLATPVNCYFQCFLWCFFKQITWWWRWWYPIHVCFFQTMYAVATIALCGVCM